MLFYSLIRIFVEKNMMDKTWTIRANEPVTLRMRKLQKGGYSLCIDISEISQLLTLIHDRMDEDEYEDDDGKSILLADYLATHKRECLATHRGNSYMHLCKNMENKLRGFLGKRYKTLHMDDIDTKMCRDFVTYLRGVRTRNGRLLSPVSVHHYFNAFKSLLNTAMKDEVIAHNPIDHMKRGEIPERPMVVRNFLDAAEVARLAATPCRNEEVSRAFLFSCLTGLRISDIRQLTWNNFRKVGGEWYCHVVMQKTQEPLICKLTTAAYALLEAVERTRLTIFRLPCTSSIERNVKRWAKRAGITKHVTFHTARHSYATIALMAGADIYTISRLLGHKNIRSTQIYAAVVDAQRDAATDGVSKLFQKQLIKLEKRRHR